MSDETFLKHFNARHLSDVKLGAELGERTLRQPAVLRAFRAFHRRCHDIAVAGQYTHEHLADWE